MNIYRLYLKLAFVLGFTDHVYRVSGSWGSRLVGSAKSSAAWAASEALIEYGFHRCPSCQWAMKSPNEHFQDLGSWCSLTRDRLARENECLELMRKRMRERAGSEWGPCLACGEMADAEEREMHHSMGCGPATHMVRMIMLSVADFAESNLRSMTESNDPPPETMH